MQWKTQICSSRLCKVPSKETKWMQKIGNFRVESDQGDKPNDVRTLPVRFLIGAKHHAIRCVEPANTKPKAKLFSLRTSSRYRGLTQWCPHPPVITGDSFRYSDTSFPHQVILTWCVTFSYFTFWSSGEFVPDLL